MTKMGRNEPCHCGSGKKHKKCCLGKTPPSVEPAKKRVDSNTATNNMQKEFKLNTTTNESHMPVRLYYQIYDKVRLISALNQLHCVEQTTKKRWHLYYHEEAQAFGLEIKYNQVSQALFPIILGYIHLVNATLLHIDVRSFERAARMIEFIDRHINREIIKVTHAASYNEVMMTTKGQAQVMSHFNLDNFFMPEDIEEIETEYTFKGLKAAMDEQENSPQGLRAVYEKYGRLFLRQIPQVEKFPVHFYQEGIKSFELSLLIKEKVAIEHYQGNKAYAMYNAIMDLTKVVKEYEPE